MKTFVILIGLTFLFCCPASAQSKPVKALPKTYLGFYKGALGPINFMVSVKANEMALALELDGNIDLYRGKHTVRKGSTEDEVIVQANLRHVKTKQAFSSSVFTFKSGNSITCEFDAGAAGTVELEKEN